MRYSRGNRGGKGRQWGVRRYEGTPEHKRKYSRTTSLFEDVRWVPGPNDEEKLVHELVCRECGARNYASFRDLLLKAGECLACWRKFETPVIQ